MHLLRRGGWLATKLLVLLLATNSRKTRLCAYAARPQEARNTLETEIAGYVASGPLEAANVWEPEISDIVVSSQADVELLEASVSEVVHDEGPEWTNANHVNVSTSADLHSALENASKGAAKYILTLNNGTYTPTQVVAALSGVESQVAGFVIQGHVEVNGHGAVIDCEHNRMRAGLAFWSTKAPVIAVVKDLTIRNCDVGVFLPKDISQANVQLSNVNITRCGRKKRMGEGGYAAVIVHSVRSVLHIQQSRVTHNYGSGILLTEKAVSSQISIENTIVGNNERVGVEIRGNQSNLVLTHSIVEESLESGVKIMGDEVKFMCLACTVQKNGHYGIFVHQAREAALTLTSATIGEQVESGFMLMECASTSLTVQSSLFVANGISGITLIGMSGGATAVISDSRFIRNLLAAYRILGSSGVVTSLRNLSVEENEGSAFILQGESLQLELTESIFSKNMGVGLVLDVTDASPANVSNCTFTGNGCGMMLSAHSSVDHVMGQNLIFRDNGQALTLLKAARANFSDCRFLSNVVGARVFNESVLRVYQPLFSKSHIGMLGQNNAELEVINAKVVQNWKGIELNDRSSIKLEGSVITDNADGVVAKDKAKVEFRLNEAGGGLTRSIVYLNAAMDIGCGDEEELKEKAQRGLLRTIFHIAVGEDSEECVKYDSVNWSMIMRMHHAKFTAALWWYLLAVIFFFNLPVVLDPDTDALWKYPTQACRILIMLALCALVAATVLVLCLLIGIYDMLWEPTLKYNGARHAEFTATPRHYFWNTLMWYCCGVTVSALCRWILETAKRINRTPEAALGNLEEEAQQHKQSLFAQLDRYTKALAKDVEEEMESDVQTHHYDQEDVDEIDEMDKKRS